MIKISLDTLKRIRAALPEMEALVVEGRILHSAWCLVRPASDADWKGPIDYVIHEDVCDFDRDVIKLAVSYFTGTEATFTAADLLGSRGTFRVRAAGYRMGPAGDH